MLETVFSAGQPSLNGNEQKYVQDCLDRGWLTQGYYVNRFERLFAEYHGVKHALAVCNGTAALHLALAALGLKPGDEVIVPDLTFVATANAVMYTGAKPVFVDVDPVTWTIDPKLIESAITRRTRAIVPVHLYGVPAAMEAINALAVKYGLFVVEDCAEALGASIGGKKVGTLGDVGCFSFYGNKTITTGEGGMVVTNDDYLAAVMRLLRGHGQQEGKRYWHVVLGFNYRLTDLQAAVGCAQMEQLDGILERRKAVFQEYWERLPFVYFQTEEAGSESGYWAMAVTLAPRFNRDRVMKDLAECGIETRPVFYPVNRLPAYNVPGDFFVTDSISKQGIVLPTHAELTPSAVNYISKQLGECLNA